MSWSLEMEREHLPREEIRWTENERYYCSVSNSYIWEVFIHDLSCKCSSNKLTKEIQLGNSSRTHIKQNGLVKKFRVTSLAEFQLHEKWRNCRFGVWLRSKACWDVFRLFYPQFVSDATSRELFWQVQDLRFALHLESNLHYFPKRQHTHSTPILPITSIIQQIGQQWITSRPINGIVRNSSGLRKHPWTAKSRLKKLLRSELDLTWMRDKTIS